MDDLGEGSMILDNEKVLLPDGTFATASIHLEWTEHGLFAAADIGGRRVGVARDPSLAEGGWERNRYWRQNA